MTDINSLRIEIDSKDKEILKNLKERMDISKKIGLVKSKDSMNILCSDREKKVFDNLIHSEVKPLDESLNEQFIKELWEVIMKYSKLNQKN